MTASVMNPKVNVSVFSVPEPSGMNFFSARHPAMAIGPIIGINLERRRTIPVEIFHQGVLSPRPSKPDPLFAEEEVRIR